jgi:hypothetical protein
VLLPPVGAALNYSIHTYKVLPEIKVEILLQLTELQASQPSQPAVFPERTALRSLGKMSFVEIRKFYGRQDGRECPEHFISDVKFAVTMSFPQAMEEDKVRYYQSLFRSHLRNPGDRPAGH